MAAGTLHVRAGIGEDRPEVGFDIMRDLALLSQH
jgi:hypothetical protein